MNGRSVEAWMEHEPTNEWDIMMKKVAAFHHKHDFAGQNGHDMADVLILLMGRSLAMELDLKAAFEKKYARIMQREALQGRLGVRVTEYRPD